MSTCVSRHGEYGAHTPDADYVCARCFALDEDALIAELHRLRADAGHGGVYEAESQALDAGVAAGRADECARIVHFLKSQDTGSRRSWAWHYADRIERGEHHGGAK
jgi:hypothetical protein